MSRVRFGLDASVFTAPETVRLGVLAEKLGYDSVWVADHLIDLEACKVDPWVVLGGIGAQTSRILLGCAVTDAQRTHPAKLAQMAATLDELTGGRAVLGLGSGEVMNIAPFGLEWREPESRIARLVEAVKMIRLLWSASRDNPVYFKGDYYRLNGAWLDEKYMSNPCPKIYIGALGASKLLRVTGEVADGWLNYFNTPELYARKIAKIREGAESAGRKLDDIDTTVYLGVALTSDSNELAEGMSLMKMLLASERNTLKRLGVNVPISEEHVYIHCIPNRAAVDAAVKASESVPDDVARQFMIYGDSVEEAVSFIEKFVEMGGRHFQLAMLTHNTAEMVKRFAEKVLPAFR